MLNICFPSRNLEFQYMLGRRCLCASPHKNPLVLSIYWASLADNISHFYNLLLVEFSSFWVTPLGERTLGSLLLASFGFCHTHLFSLLILHSSIAVNIAKF